MKNQFSLQIALDGGAAPPTAFRLFTSGTVETTKGIFKFDEGAAGKVMAAAKDWGNEYPVDYDHAMVGMFSVDPAESGKAAGWFTPEVRGGELWASNVTWTPRASKALSDREYRYCSPTFCADEDGSITELVNVALTNLPATKRMQPLMANRFTNPSGAEPDKEPRMKTLLSKLGLAETATEAEGLVALSSLLELRSKLLEATKTASQSEALGAVQALQASAAKVIELSAKIAAVEAAKAEAEVVTIVDEAVKSGQIAPAQKEVMLKMGRTDLAMLKGFLAATPKPRTAREPGAAPGVSTDELNLTAEEREGCKKLGISFKAYAEHKAKSLNAA